MTTGNRTSRPGQYFSIFKKPDGRTILFKLELEYAIGMIIAEDVISQFFQDTVQFQFGEFYF